MQKKLKNIIKFFMPDFIIQIVKNWEQKRIIKKWRDNGSVLPPPHEVKQMIVQQYHQIYSYSCFIETGTYIGKMVDAQKRMFEKVFSIELSLDLYKKAALRFKKDTNVKIIHGDSGKVLQELMASIYEPAIFWLDGHYSGGITAKGEKECPIFEELNAIFDYQKLNHVILIDDARCFTGKYDYPTIQELINYISNKNAEYQFKIENDIIQCFIKKESTVS